jgi:uncharacterized membrane protein
MSRVERETHWVIDDLYPNQLDPTVVEERCPDPPAGTVALLAWSSAAGRPAPGLLSGALRGAVPVGSERTMLQDVPFGLRRLVDIGNRALFPAVSDPYTVWVPVIRFMSCDLRVLMDQPTESIPPHDPPSRYGDS